MTRSNLWSRLITRQATNPPLVYVHGFCHLVAALSYCPSHNHRSIEIVYHPAGRGTTRLENGREIPFEEGNVVIYAPEEKHDQTMTHEGEDFCVHIAIPPALRRLSASCFSIRKIEQPHLIEDLRFLSRDHVRVSPAQQTILNLRATSILLSLLQLAGAESEASAAPGMQNHVERAEQYIRDHFATIGTLKQVAGELGLSHDHLRHLFTAHRGRTMVRYLNEVRIERAKTLLAHTRVPLKQIATMCGFRDEYYFSAVFRRLAKASPGRYRIRNT